MSKAQTALLLSLIAIILCACTAIILSMVPSQADKAFRTQLSALGLNEAQIPPPERRLTALRYNNIILDTEERASIDTLTINYSITGLLFGKTFNTITIDGLYLPGEIDAAENLTLTGTETLSLKGTKTPFKTLSIKNATLSLITAQLGGVRITFDSQINTEDNGAHTLTASIASKQSQFELLGKLSANLNRNTTDNGAWTANFDIESAKLERPKFKVTRANGTAQITGNNLSITNIDAQIRAGALRLADTPWQNANITMTGPLNALKLIVEARSSGVDGLELSIESIRQDGGPFAWTGRIFTPQAQIAQDFLKTTGRLPYNIGNFPLLNAKGSAEILLKPDSNAKNKDSLVFKVTNLTSKESFIGNVEHHANERIAIIAAQ